MLLQLHKILNPNLLLHGLIWTKIPFLLDRGLTTFYFRLIGFWIFR